MSCGATQLARNVFSLLLTTFETIQTWPLELRTRAPGAGGRERYRTSTESGKWKTTPISSALGSS
jgi:hypothetical protein